MKQKKGYISRVKKNNFYLLLSVISFVVISLSLTSALYALGVNLDFPQDQATKSSSSI